MQRLSSDELKRAQGETLATPKIRYGLLARALFVTMDLLYGRRRHLSKFKVLEVIARVPYQAWEHVAYIAITHMHRRPDFAQRVFRESRVQQDNEQWHLLILEELTDRKGIREGFVRPRGSSLLNAWFEDHAEREYMRYVAENPALESEPFESIFADDYGHFASLADLFRQIGYDERVHKLESLERVETARFR